MVFAVMAEAPAPPKPPAALEVPTVMMEAPAPPEPPAARNAIAVTDETPAPHESPAVPAVPIESSECGALVPIQSKHSPLVPAMPVALPATGKPPKLEGQASMEKMSPGGAGKGMRVKPAEKDKPVADEGRDLEQEQDR